MIVFKMAWRNIWRNKRRTYITMASIFFAVILSSFMMSIKEGMYAQMIDSTIGNYTGFIQINTSAFTEDHLLDDGMEFTESIITILDLESKISHYIPRIENFALAAGADQTKGSMVIGTDIEKERQATELHKRVIDGTYLSKSDEGVLVGKGLAEYLKVKAGDTLVLLSQGYHGSSAAGKFPIRGIVTFGSPELSKQLVILTLENAQQFYSCSGIVTQINIWPEDDKLDKSMLSRLEKSFDDDLDVRTWKEVLPEVSDMIEADKVEGYVFMFILYLVISFGIFGTLLMMLIERMYEFGMLISIGMKRSKLALMVWFEAVALTLAGAMLGILGAVPICYYFNLNPIKFGNEIEKMFEEYGFEAVMRTSLDLNIFLEQAVLIVLVSSILSLYPFMKILRMNALSAMKA